MTPENFYAKSAFSTRHCVWLTREQGQIYNFYLESDFLYKWVPSAAKWDLDLWRAREVSNRG